jgi:hypothetical protein
MLSFSAYYSSELALFTSVHGHIKAEIEAGKLGRRFGH